MRTLVGLAIAGIVLSACGPKVPNSGQQGVGFGDYQTYLNQRSTEAANGQISNSPLAAAPATTTALPAPPAAIYGVGGTAPATAQPAASSAKLDAAAASAPQGTIGAEALAALKATAPGGAGGEAPRLGAPLDATGATGGRAPAPVTEATNRSGAGPNLAAYALNATNKPGQTVYERGGFKMISSDRACAKFVSPDLAQMDFLERGGPVRDPGNLDPDGDGFACGWDPRPFQAARP